MLLSGDFFGNLAVAAIILYSDFDTFSKKSLDQVPWPHIFIVAVNAELADEREFPDVKGPNADSERRYLIGQLKARRMAFDEIPEGVPPLGDQYRWPRADEVRRVIAFARTRRKLLQVAEMGAKPSEKKELARAREEAQKIIEIWQEVLEVVSPDTRVVNRRLALLRLRTKLGTDVYYKGELPFFASQDPSKDSP